MPFNEELPEFQKTGTKPPATILNTNGWGAGTKPPADWFNWLFNKIYLSLKELQLKSINTDEKGSINGVATLGADGKVPSTQINVDVSGLATDGELIAVDEKVDTHIAKDGTLLQKGHVQLFSGVTSLSEGLAATPKAVKTAMDRADAAFLQANDQKTKWASVIGSPLLASDTSTVLQSKSQTIKNTLASNLTSKGQSSVGTETLTALVNKVPLINTGKRFADGTGTSNVSKVLSVTGLAFRPTRINLSYTIGTQTHQMFYDLSSRPRDSGGRWMDGNSRYTDSSSIGANVATGMSDLSIDAWGITSSGFSVTIPHASQSSISWFALE